MRWNGLCKDNNGNEPLLFSGYPYISFEKSKETFHSTNLPGPNFVLFSLRWDYLRCNFPVLTRLNYFISLCFCKSLFSTSPIHTSRERFKTKRIIYLIHGLCVTKITTASSYRHQEGLLFEAQFRKTFRTVQTEILKKSEGRVRVSQIMSYIPQLDFPRNLASKRLLSINETLHNRFAHLTSYGPSNSSVGPSNWPGLCSDGKKQSPIDINTTTAMYDTSLGGFTLVNYAHTPHDVNFNATNKGKGLEISFDSHVYNVSGGGLTGIYTTVQFHLHWGSSNGNGSEHTVNGMMYPAEVCYVRCYMWQR